MAKPGESTKGYDFEDGTSGIIGAAFAVHNELGPGFQEVVYQRALAMELEAAGIEWSREESIQTLSYLKASRFRVALLINFGGEKVEFKRLINERGKYAHLKE